MVDRAVRTSMSVSIALLLDASIILGQPLSALLTEMLLQEHCVPRVAFVHCVRKITDEGHQADDEINNNIHHHHCSQAGW